MTDQRTLRALQGELRRALAALVDPIERKIVREDLTTTTHHAPSLLEQLDQALAHGGETGKASGARTTEPLRLAAADLRRQVERAAAELHYNAMVADADPVSRFRAAAAIAGRWADGDRVAWVVHELQYWAAQINNLLDPPRQLHMAAACPACGAGMVWRGDQEHGHVQVPALQIDPERGCVCLACQHCWPPANFELLREVLEQQDQAQPSRPRLRSGAEGNGGWTGTIRPIEEDDQHE
ncbi:DUF7341 domain-containing protein [Amycolatopsis methanolica]|uniref:Gp104 n=1 Tax=Amycolatopsis methanolica 239 TaxID=1068978 RepID=A0A076N6G2_AMYME|nr:hypothetical protein [Amycolatopsis methanolica]AIJ26376.1 gp104 [Amycolatopsis methanolica 239]AIJ26435.1 gp104 [Amycolatopsis methanolica 239]